ncbi:hypothetical protein HanIR_Chr12g0579281 [Helianthus annuus]|nr:hypothetical protein HanIR_Chr12g0579281 [Helianthus annuus]
MFRHTKIYQFSYQEYYLLFCTQVSRHIKGYNKILKNVFFFFFFFVYVCYLFSASTNKSLHLDNGLNTTQSSHSMTPNQMSSHSRLQFDHIFMFDQLSLSLKIIFNHKSQNTIKTQ